MSKSVVISKFQDIRVFLNIHSYERKDHNNKNIYNKVNINLISMRPNNINFNYFLKREIAF